MDPVYVFVKQVYKMFDENPTDLGNLYLEGSMMTFEGQRIMGKDSILAKLISHPFTRCQHRINSVDFHTSDAAVGWLVLVSGVLDFDWLDGERQALNFT
ncbi:nuclear transport factor 2B-like [Syzygium oleosum]|uniref:nuclear transport factor 2B-like n=1 Tax=Syzygium oleosum TaxID=219896 RepID=UPI0024BBC333|nr:nuclear transport factor 2B-like [Syzygium oleosum]